MGVSEKIGGTLFWGPYNKDPTIKDPILGFPIFGNSLIVPTYFCYTKAAQSPILIMKAPTLPACTYSDPCQEPLRGPLNPKARDPKPP